MPIFKFHQGAVGTAPDQDSALFPVKDLPFSLFFPAIDIGYSTGYFRKQLEMVLKHPLIEGCICVDLNVGQHDLCQRDHSRLDQGKLSLHPSENDSPCGPFGLVLITTCVGRPPVFFHGLKAGFPPQRKAKDLLPPFSIMNDIAVTSPPSYSVRTCLAPAFSEERLNPPAVCSHGIFVLAIEHGYPPETMLKGSRISTPGNSGLPPR